MIDYTPHHQYNEIVDYIPPQKDVIRGKIVDYLLLFIYIALLGWVFMRILPCSSIWLWIVYAIALIIIGLLIGIVFMFIHMMKIGWEGLIVDGIESSNSNAKSRMILIHQSEVLNIFPKSIFPISIIGKGISHGCFSITSEGLNKTKELRKPILLWAYK